MKLYELSITQICDGTIIRNDGEVFSDFNLVEKALKEFVKHEDKAIRKRSDFKDWVCDDGEPYSNNIDKGAFCVGVNGDWNNNSTNAYISIHDVDTWIYVVTILHDTNSSGVSSKVKTFDCLEKCEEYAKKEQEQFCYDYDIAEEEWTDHVWGDEYDTQWDEINGCGTFITENAYTDRLTIEIVRSKVE